MLDEFQLSDLKFSLKLNSLSCMVAAMLSKMITLTVVYFCIQFVKIHFLCNFFCKFEYLDRLLPQCWRFYRYHSKWDEKSDVDEDLLEFFRTKAILKNNNKSTDIKKVLSAKNLYLNSVVFNYLCGKLMSIACYVVELF